MFYGLKVRAHILKTAVVHPAYGPETADALGRAVSYLGPVWKSLVKLLKRERLSPREGAVVAADWLSKNAFPDRLGFPIRKAMRFTSASIQGSLLPAVASLDQIMVRASEELTVEEYVLPHLSAVADSLIVKHSVVDPKIFPNNVNAHVDRLLKVHLDQNPEITSFDAAIIKLTEYKGIMADLKAPGHLVSSFDDAIQTLRGVAPDR